jgi:predicted extracellular nuclease
MPKIYQAFPTTGSWTASARVKERASPSLENGEGPFRVDLVAYTNNGKRAGSSGEIITVSKNAQTYTAISAIQGAGHASPYDGQDVTDVLGVITGTENRGFWMQSPNPDGDAAH